jgi:hypothetical protein
VQRQAQLTKLISIITDTQLNRYKNLYINCNFLNFHMHTRLYTHMLANRLDQLFIIVDRPNLCDRLFDIQQSIF